MTVLPIVDRELRVSARQQATYWVRLGVAFAAVFLGAVVFVLTFSLPPAQTGRYIFECLAGVMMVHCLAYGRRATADCLSQEKREGTLGLLFLTDLKGHDVVLGKLVATSVRGFYGLLAVFPVLAVPLLLGGITSGEFWRVALVLMDTFLFSLAIGILGSALSRDQQRAMAANVTLLLLLMAAPAACMFALEHFAPGVRRLPQLLFSCPVYAFYLCDDAQYGMAQGHFWWTVGVIHSLTWLLVLAAGWIIPHAWQDLPSRAGRNRWRELWRTWRDGPVAGKAAFRKRTLDANAFYWLAARARFKPVHVWTFLACMAVWWLSLRLVFGSLWLDPATAILTAVMLNFALKVWLTIEAGRQLAEDRQSGAFELLLSVPLSVADILRGQQLALRRQFLRPTLVVLGIGFLLMWTARWRASDNQAQAIWLAGMFMLMADLVALSWVGMWRALLARSHNLATIRTVFDVLVLPWVLFGTVLSIGMLWYELVLGKEWSPDWRFLLAVWFGLGLATDLGMGLKAWWQLRTRFRELALRRFNPAPSRISRWFGRGPAGSAAAESPGATMPGVRIDEPQRRDERGEGNEKGVSASIAPLRLRLPVRKSRKRWAVAGCLILAIICFGVILLRPGPHWPPPVVFSVNQSNGPVRVFSGTGGMILILPDGSLWRWGKAGVAVFPRAEVPERIGTHRDWVQAAGGFGHLVGIRRDGGLWEWGGSLGKPGQFAGSTSEARLLDMHRDWSAIAAAAASSVAIRSNGTLWAWGNSALSQLSTGPGPGPSYPVQIGTDTNWAAVCCAWNAAMALRRDGTLWAWGAVHVVGNGWATVNNLPTPTQVCVESNWTGFVPGGFLALVQNQAGELWEPFHAAPSPEASAASSFRLVVSKAVPGRFAAAWCGGPRTYELRSDGTLWEREQPLNSYSTTQLGEWRRLGQRSDWSALWGGGGTAMGLTADGTIWTWGIDVGREPVPDFWSRFKLAQGRLITMVGPTPRPMLAGATPVYEKQPRPLMRLVFTNSMRSAEAGTAGSK